MEQGVLLSLGQLLVFNTEKKGSTSNQQVNYYKKDHKHYDKVSHLQPTDMLLMAAAN